MTLARVTFRSALVASVLAVAGTTQAQSRQIDSGLNSLKGLDGLPDGVTITVSTVPGTIDARAAAMALCMSWTWGDVDTATDVPMITVHKNSAAATQKPAVLVVAGTDGRHAVGQVVAMGVARSIALHHADALDAVDVVVIPCIDTETSALLSGSFVSASSYATRLVGWKNDEDGDGRIDEDGPDDLNKDGFITMMRIANPPPGMDREWIIDPDDPRIMRKPKKDEGEIATHAMMIESIDEDGDGEYAEDAIGSIIVDKHFPHMWPEFSTGSGRFALDYPSSRAFATYLESNKSIAAVVVYGPRDSVTKIPDGGKFDPSGQVPTGIERGDEDLYKAVSKAFGEITHIKSTPDTIEKGFGEGSFAGWTYAHMGIPTFATPVWVRPDLLEETKDDKKEETKDDNAEAPEVPDSIVISGHTIALTEAGVAEATAWMEEQLTPEQTMVAAQEIMNLPTATREKLGSLTPSAIEARKKAEAEKEKKKAEKSDKDAEKDATDAKPAEASAAAEPSKPTYESVTIGGKTIELSTAGIQSAMGELDSMTDAERQSIMQEFMALPEPVREKFMTVGQGGTIDEPQPEAAPARADKPAPKKTGKDDKKKTEDEKWMAYFDEHSGITGIPPGFVQWESFDHPQLGMVEIGGLVPAAMYNPAEFDGIERGVLYGRLVDQQAKFVAKLASMMPKVTINEPKVQDLGNGIWRIDLRIVNTGEMATTSAIGNKTGRWARNMVRIDLPKERILSGSRASGFNSLGAMGGDWNGSWVVNASGMSSVKFTIDGPAIPKTEIDIKPTRTGGAR